MARAVNRPLEIAPLEIALPSLSASITPLNARAAAPPPAFHTAGPPLDSEAVRAIFSSPKKLREIAILTEVLGPPLARRPERRLR
jgi:hypothetical protein